MNSTKDKGFQALLCIAQLPKYMIQYTDRYNIAEFLLHSLSGQNCFNLSKAAYFIDNPDFNHLQGIVGYHELESYKNNHWENPDLFAQHMQEKNFNKIVRAMSLPSIQRNQKQHKDVGEELAYTLEINQPQILTWPLKHQNYGLLIFESPASSLDNEFHEQLELGAHLLGFCPVL